MKAIAWLIRLVFFLVVLWFALKNTTPVPVRLTERVVWNDVPLIVVMLACLVIGALAGAAALAPRLFRRRRPSRHERELMAETATTIQPGDLPGDRLADAARNIGAVGQLDADTRFPR
jgi:lipopolysaccharide assembly protein A